nr:helitron helicase-like domain-containing protein [Tanacetum cinerariifolium]
ESSTLGPPVVTKNLPHMSIERHRPTTLGDGVVCAVRNGIECSTTTQSSTADDVTELPPLSDHHSHSADITGRHDSGMELLSKKTSMVPTSSSGRSADANTYSLPVNNEVIEPTSSLSEEFSPPYMDLGDCDCQCQHCGCLFWSNTRFKIRLYNMGGMRGYELPTSDILRGIVFESGPRIRTDFDVIIEFRGGHPKRINKLHQSYMSLQLPLLFIFGQPGFYPELRLKPRDGKS